MSSCCLKNIEIQPKLLLNKTLSHYESSIRTPLKIVLNYSVTQLLSFILPIYFFLYR